MTDEIEYSEVPALTEDNTVIQIKDHLIQVHRYHPDSKTKKADLLIHHDCLHAQSIEEVAEIILHHKPDLPEHHRYSTVNNLWDWTKRMRARSVSKDHPHVHLKTDALTGDAALAAAFEAIKDPTAELPDKPLTVSERKLLTDLINNDFGKLKTEMRGFVDAQLASTMAELAAENETKQAGKIVWSERRRALTDKYEADFRVLQAEAESAGYSVPGNSGGIVYSQTIGVVGYQQAVEKAKEEHRLALQAATNTVEAQRLTAIRRVMLASLTPAGRAMLDTLPDAKTMMVEAQQTAVRQLTS